MSNHNKETEARCPHCYRHYVEGTAAWALYMMRMGHKVTNPKYDPRVYHLPEGGMIHVNGIKSIAGNQWIDYWCIDIPDGWQLYEPEPEQTVCEFCNGNGAYATTRANRTGYERCPTCNGTGKVNKQPQPAYAVGDWVEFNPGSNPHQVRIVKVDGEKLHYIDEKGYQTHIYISAITRKLKPSEVIVKIGCLSGAVAPGCSDATIMIVPIGYNGFGDVAIIPVAMLDAPTRILVECLLKAQEEK